MERLEWDCFPSEAKDGIESRDWSKENIETVVVWMHAEWCGPCRRIEPEVHSMVSSVMERTNKVKFYDSMVPKDDFEKEELKELWGFTTIPVFFVMDTNTMKWEAMKWDSFKQCALFYN